MYYIILILNKEVLFLVDRNKTTDTWWSKDPKLAMCYFKYNIAERRSKGFTKGKIKIVDKDGFEFYSELNRNGD